MTNEEFKRLMDLKKHFLTNYILLPKTNEESIVSVGAIESRETFALDLSRKSTIILTRKRYQNRLVPANELLVRLEIDSKPHMNPDGTLISKDHIHIFKEGYGLSWAYELTYFDNTLFKNPDDFTSVFYDFCSYCNILIENTDIQGVM